MTAVHPRPFLRWAGGKDRQAELILGLLPEYVGATYHEPFLGAGAVFLALRRSGFLGPAILSDLNADLIDCWAEVGSAPEEIAEWLDAQPTDERTYYRIRAIDPRKLDPTTRAARFIYLNRTCFNGLYRLGPDFRDPKRLVFNVPWGKRNGAVLYERRNLDAVSETLSRTPVRLNGCSFETSMKLIRPGDLVYLDPPYVPIKSTSFTHYTGSEFSYAEQEQLADCFDRLVDLGARVIASNAKTPWVVDRYRRYELHTINAARSIAAEGNRRAPVPEVLIVGRVKGVNEWESRSGSSEPNNGSESSDDQTRPRNANRSRSRSKRSSTPSRKHSPSRRQSPNAESGSSEPASIANSTEAPSRPSSKPSEEPPTRPDRPPEPSSDPAGPVAAVAESTTRSAASSASKSRAATSITSPSDKALCQTRLLAIDPGESESGWVLLEGAWPRPRIVALSSSEPNEQIRSRFLAGSYFGSDERPTDLVVETMRWRGQPMFWQSIATLVWIGRIQELWLRNGDEASYHEIVRETVKLYCCGAVARKDRHVREAMIERYGGRSAIGDVDFPGPLRGLAKHAWQALGLGVTWFAQLVGDADLDGRRR